MSVTVTISTKDRYFSTLPSAIMSVYNQTVAPERLLIFDDGEQKDLRDTGLYSNLFRLLTLKNIKCEVIFGERKGQVSNHQKALDMCSSDFLWRLDDDEVAEPNVLESLLDVITGSDKIGAVGGLVIDPKTSLFSRPGVASSKIEDVYMNLNAQWFYHPEDKKPYSVDHLYSSFLIRKEAASKYPDNLSPVGHREETIFTYTMKLNGWDLRVDPRCITWHFRNPEGGIRSYPNMDMWRHDEMMFGYFLANNHVHLSRFFIVMVTGALGDHIVFYNEVWPLIKEKHRGERIILANYFPEVFEDENEAEKVPIEHAASIWKPDDYSAYGWAIKNNFYGTYVEACKYLYGVA